VPQAGEFASGERRQVGDADLATRPCRVAAAAARAHTRPAAA